MYKFYCLAIHYGVHNISLSILKIMVCLRSGVTLNILCMFVASSYSRTTEHIYKIKPCTSWFCWTARPAKRDWAASSRRRATECDVDGRVESAPTLYLHNKMKNWSTLLLFSRAGKPVPPSNGLFVFAFGFDFDLYIFRYFCHFEVFSGAGR
jgi:hypothetical protein